MQVFVSHRSIDLWVARQLSSKIEDAGASTFLDDADIHGGDEIDATVQAGLQASDEFLVLLTWPALESPYIWDGVRIFVLR